MLRITRTAGDAIAIVKLEGKLLEPWVEEVRRAVIAPDRAATHTAILDLADLTFVDAAGAKLLQHFLASGIQLGNCSNFVREMIRERKG